MKSSAIAVLAGLCASVVSCVAFGQGVADAYTLVELPGLAGSVSSRAAAINNSGMVVGNSFDGTDYTAVYWDSTGIPAVLGTAPKASSFCLDVNDEGSVLVRVLGGGAGDETLVHTFDGAILSLPAPADVSFFAVGSSLNARGEVAGFGYWTDPGDPNYSENVAIRWERTPTGMEAARFGGDENESYMTPHMTDSGLVVVGGADGGGASAHFFDPRTNQAGYGGLGDYIEVFDVTDTKAYLSIEYSGSSGTPGSPFVHVPGGPFQFLQAINCDQPGAGCFWYFIDLNLPDYLPIRPAALNDAMLVVGDTDVVLLDANGEAFDKEEAPAAFVWSAETGTVRLSTRVVDGSDDGWELRSASDINELGWIAGSGIKDGQSRAFLLVPSDYCPGDVNRDGEVTPTDFTAWINAFNSGCD